MAHWPRVERVISILFSTRSFLPHGLDYIDVYVSLFNWDHEVGLFFGSSIVLS